MITLYKGREWDEVQAIITDAENESISTEVNGDRTLSFELNRDSPALKHLQCDMCIRESYNNQLYRIVKIRKSEGKADNVDVEARHIYYDSKKMFLNSFERHLNGEGFEIFKDIWKDTNFNVLDESQIAELGMTMCDMITDFDERNHVTLDNITSELISQLCCGELYIDNDNIALVDEIGAGYEPLILELDKNINNVSIEQDFEDIITKLYVYGKDDLDLTDKLGKMFIVSDNTNLYGTKEGYLCWSEISDIDMLLSKARWQFDESNQNRIDVPYVTISADYVDLSSIVEGVQPIHLGQRVKVLGYDNLRVTKIVEYPAEPTKKQITIGRVKKDTFYFLKKFNKTADAYIASTKSAKGNTAFYNTIVQVSKEATLAADVLEAGAVFSTDIFTERFQTNITKYICKPNLVADGTSWKWKDEAHSYYTTNKDKIRGYIKMEGIEQKFIEAHLLTPADYANITQEECEPLLVNNKQIYYTSVASGANAYQFFTFTEPKQKYNNISAENAAMFKVYIRKATAEYVKRVDKFELVDVAAEDGTVSQTYEVTTQYGVGDSNGNGIYTMTKHSDKCKLTYKSRTDGAELGYIIDDNGTKIIRNDIEMINIAAREVDSINEMSGENWKDGDIGFIVS